MDLVVTHEIGFVAIYKAQIQMHGHIPGSTTVLLIPNKICLVVDQKFSPVSIWYT